jgi:sporulation protein YlmC with PRC-barrel domain
MLRNASAIKGYAIAASDGRIGTVSDFLFDDDSWLVRWLVVDTGKWLSGRKVLLPPLRLGAPQSKGTGIYCSIDPCLSVCLTKAWSSPKRVKASSSLQL